MSLTAEQRTELIKNLNECDAGIAMIQAKITPIRKVLQPLIDEQLAIDERKFSLADELGVEILGQCVTCNCYLFSGDLGSQTTDGELQCAGHSPSWQDVKESWEDGTFPLQQQEPKAYADMLGAYNAHIEAGGKPEDVPLSPL